MADAEKNGNQNDFSEELEGIREAEAEKEKIVEKAKKDADGIVAEANAEAKKIAEKAAEEAEKIEEEAIEKAGKELAAAEAKILAKAKKDADEILAMGIPPAAIRKAVQRILE